MLCKSVLINSFAKLVATVLILNDGLPIHVTQLDFLGLSRQLQIIFASNARKEIDSLAPSTGTRFSSNRKRMIHFKFGRSLDLWINYFMDGKLLQWQSVIMQEHMFSSLYMMISGCGLTFKNRFYGTTDHLANELINTTLAQQLDTVPTILSNRLVLDSILVRSRSS